MVMFWNLPALHLQEQLETVETNCENTQPVNVTDTQPAAADREIASRDCAISPAVLFIPQEPVHVNPSTVQRASQRTKSPEHPPDLSDTSSVTMSNDFIEEAEVFMREQDVEPSVAVLDADAVQHLSWPCDSVSPISRTYSDSFLQRRRPLYGSVNRDDVGRDTLLTRDGQAAGDTGTSGVSAVGDVGASQTVRETSVVPTEPEPPSHSLTWQYYYDGKCPHDMY